MNVNKKLNLDISTQDVSSKIIEISNIPVSVQEVKPINTPLDNQISIPTTNIEKDNNSIFQVSRK
jgi:hypothetical protein